MLTSRNKLKRKDMKETYRLTDVREYKPSTYADKQNGSPEEPAKPRGAKGPDGNRQTEHREPKSKEPDTETNRPKIS